MIRKNSYVDSYRSIILVLVTFLSGCNPCQTTDDCDNSNACFPQSCSAEGICVVDVIECIEGNVCVDGDCIPICTKDDDCDDGQFCNGIETCSVNGVCVVGTTKNCTDNNNCTNDSCNENTNRCDNIEVMCVGTDVCDLETGVCIPGPCDVDADCNDGDICTTDNCATVAQQCEHNIVDCDDGDACTNDSCDQADGSCVNTEVDCRDDEVCADGVCTTCMACTSDTDCLDDGLFCNGIESCAANACCASSGDPCLPNETCNEDSAACLSGCDGNGACAILPACYSPNVAVTVSITISPPTDAPAAALADSPPSGWIVDSASISDSGAFDSNFEKVKWAFIDNLTLTVTYIVMPSSQTTGLACFSGTVVFDSGGNEQSVKGDRCIDLCEGG